ncbi:hypothetical protein [Candidatus Amoebophilus asiaticus]|nr:hypothetical protein [Candidatus Amoebophilus asiaticus]
MSFEYVLADSWLTTKDNLQLIHHQLKKECIFGTKSNRLVALSIEAKK